MRSIGEIVETAGGWELVAATHCPVGHQLRGNQLVSYVPCSCDADDVAGHTAWTCRGCDATMIAECGSQDARRFPLAGSASAIKLPAVS